MNRYAIVGFRNEKNLKNSKLLGILDDIGYVQVDEHLTFSNGESLVRLFWVHQLDQHIDEYKGGHLRKEFIKRLLTKIMPKIVDFVPEERGNVIFNGLKPAEFFFQIILDRVNFFEIDKDLTIREDLSLLLNEISGIISDDELFKITKLLETDIKHTIFYKYKSNWTDVNFHILPTTQTRGMQVCDPEPWHKLLNND